jgi:hypothetical protein
MTITYDVLQNPALALCSSGPLANVGRAINPTTVELQYLKAEIELARNRSVRQKPNVTLSLSQRLFIDNRSLGNF